MTGKSHLASAASMAVITDASFKLISEFAGKSDLFSAYRSYITCGLTENISASSVAAAVLSAGFLFIGSLLPDIDSEKSMLGRLIHLPVKHRTFTHSVFFILPFIIGGFFWQPFLWLSYGMFSHLLCDSFSKAGICWLWPLSGYKEYENGVSIKKGHLLKFYRTGERSEYFCVLVGFILALVLSVKAYFGLF